MADTADAGLGLLKRKSLLRPDEVAAILRLSRRTIYRMIHEGRLAAVKMGPDPSPWRIKAETIKALLHQGF